MRLKDIAPGQTLVLYCGREWLPRMRLPSEEHLEEVQVHAVETVEEARGAIERHVRVQREDGSISKVTCRQLIGTPEQVQVLRSLHARERATWEADRDALLATVRAPVRGATLSVRGTWYPGAPPATLRLTLTAHERITGALAALGVPALDVTATKDELFAHAERHGLPVRCRRRRGLVSTCVVAVVIDDTDAVQTIIPAPRYA